MSAAADPFDVLFAGLEKLGPGDNAHTRHVLLDHPEASVRALAADTLREIEIFQQADDSYGYVFYVAQRTTRVC